MDRVTKGTESLKLDDSSTNGSAPPDIAAMLPELPPGRTLNARMTFEETLADLNKHPLFMTELDTSEDNEELAALQALAYDGTPLENAANFKEQGNECFREKRWPDAKEFYGKGIAILAAEESRRAKGEKKRVKKAAEPVTINSEADNSPNVDLEEDPRPKEEDFEEVAEDPAEVKSEQALLETLYINRAACHLELRNYRSCTLDCASALRLNPRNIKAFYRSARALLAVNKIAEADDACARGLEIDPSNKPLLALAQDIIKASEADAARRKIEKERQEKERRRETLLKAALQARGIRTRSTGRPPDMEDAKVKLSPDELDPASALVFPTLLLYPCHLESDFIKAFSERESLDQHFGYVFPLPWDRTGEYSPAGVECYVETVSGGLVKVGRKVPLLKVLSGGNVEVVDDLLKIFVVPKSRAEGWVKEWKEKKANGEK
ncbi:TPR-like protein [Parathielavia appendiculata]|uniref:TPR-like protein n=1 Tax=Parathielavia appendiculata TaxID=2587402 RepID=A0AAN6U4Z9_9PEZI|nr:TPR-like protein [Parathielavia appendiculata]